MNEEQDREQARLGKKWMELSAAAKKRTIWINRLPIKSREEFLKLADEEFEGDWGMTLKWLLDFRKGLLSNPNEMLSAKIDAIAEEVGEIQKRLEKPVVVNNTMTAADGSEKNRITR